MCNFNANTHFPTKKPLWHLRKNNYSINFYSMEYKLFNGVQNMNKKIHENRCNRVHLSSFSSKKLLFTKTNLLKPKGVLRWKGCRDSLLRREKWQMRKGNSVGIYLVVKISSNITPMRPKSTKKIKCVAPYFYVRPKYIGFF